MENETMITVDCKYLAENGKAPDENMIDRMYANIERHALYKGYRNKISERQYWSYFGDHMIFMIAIDYEHADI